MAVTSEAVSLPVLVSPPPETLAVLVMLDAALLDPGPGMLVVATVDALVEGRHFVMAISTPEEIGRKALAVNLSDLAAMGA